MNRTTRVLTEGAMAFKNSRRNLEMNAKLYLTERKEERKECEINAEIRLELAVRISSRIWL